MLRKLAIAAAIFIAIVWLLSSPTGAAESVNSVFSLLYDAAQSVATFLDALF